MDARIGANDAMLDGLILFTFQDDDGCEHHLVVVDNEKVWEPPLKKEDVRFAEMLANQSCPSIMTDDVAFAQMTTVSHMYEQDPKGTERLCEIAKRRGYKPKPTDVYLQSIADSEGDPLAFCGHGQGRGHIRKVLEARGQSGEGLVTVKGREPEHDPYEHPKHKLNPKIVERIRKRRIKENPELARADQAELRSNIVEQHSLK